MLTEIKIHTRLLHILFLIPVAYIIVYSQVTKSSQDEDVFYADSYSPSATQSTRKHTPSSYEIEHAVALLKQTFPLTPLLETKRPEKPIEWFTKEYLGEGKLGDLHDKLDLNGIIFSRFPNLLKDVDKHSATIKPERCVAIITGEGGLFSCLPELANICPLIIQVNSNAATLHFTKNLLDNLDSINSEDENEGDIDGEKFISAGISKLRNAHWLKTTDEEDILEQHRKYIQSMGPLHFLHSYERLKQFKEVSNSQVVQVEANYFIEEDMVKLSTILKENNLSVVYINLTNISEKFQDFYELNPFENSLFSADPFCHVSNLPFASYALCAHSCMCAPMHYIQHHTTKDLRSQLYIRALYRRDRMIKSLAACLDNDSGMMYTNQDRPYSLIDVCRFLVSIPRDRIINPIAHLRLSLAHFPARVVEEPDCDFLNDADLILMRTEPEEPEKGMPLLPSTTPSFLTSLHQDWTAFQKEIPALKRELLSNEYYSKNLGKRQPIMNIFECAEHEYQSYTAQQEGKSQIFSPFPPSERPSQKR